MIRTLDHFIQDRMPNGRPPPHPWVYPDLGGVGHLRKCKSSILSGLPQAKPYPDRRAHARLSQSDWVVCITANLAEPGPKLSQLVLNWKCGETESVGLELRSRTNEKILTFMVRWSAVDRSRRGESQRTPFISSCS